MGKRVYAGTSALYRRVCANAPQPAAAAGKQPHHIKRCLCVTWNSRIGRGYKERVALYIQIAPEALSDAFYLPGACFS